MANIFDNPAFQFLQRPSMEDFLKRCQQRFNRFGLSDADINDAIKSACDFFNIPMPRMIQDLTNDQNGQTMFMNWDRGNYYDDVLCFNMQQLINMNVTNKEAFSLVMTQNAATVSFKTPNFLVWLTDNGSLNYVQTSLWDAEQDYGICLP